MKRYSRVLAVLLVSGVALAGLFYYVRVTEVIHPSYAADSEYGCVWKPFQDNKLGIRLLVQQCEDPDARYVFSVVDNRVEQHRPSDDTIYGGHTIVEVFTKPATQPIQEAIQDRFIESLPNSFSKTCIVSGGSSSSTSTKQLYTISPNAARMEAITVEAGTDIPVYSECGEYSIGQGLWYFEYQPEHSKTQYAFVVVGQDQPLFDKNSIELFTPNSWSLRSFLYPFLPVAN